MISFALNSHDHNTYDGAFHNQIERHSRKKHNLPYSNSKKFYNETYLKHTENKCLTFTRFGLKSIGKIHIDTDFLDFKPYNLWDYVFKDNVYYIDHHQSHACYAFLSSQFKESDILAIDGSGSNFKCIFVTTNGEIKDLSNKLPIGLLWDKFSEKLNFGTFGAGKLMGLSGYGTYHQYYENLLDYLIDDVDNFKTNIKLLQIGNKKNLAFNLQYFTIKKIISNILPLKTSNNLCISGGVGYNGYLNEALTNYWEKVFVPPAVGDEGQSLGSFMHYEYTNNNNIHIPNVFAGKEYTINEKIFDGLSYEKRKDFDTFAAKEISEGKIIGWFQGKSESGNRALGNRSILADPRNPNIKNIINNQVKRREDFRPFAPAVLEDYYDEYFDTKYPSPYMSRICKVKSDKIPGVTHIDNTARIQTVNKKFNKKFYNVINKFYNITNVPILLNTSFNCHEPIVETPEDAVNTFKYTNLDTLIIDNYVVKKKY